MKNILLITSLYPADDVKFLNNTSVCHYFSKEWVKLGHNVRVIFSYRIYPWYYYPVIKIMKKRLARTQAAAILDKRLTSPHHYEMDGVKVCRLPIYKSRPHGEFDAEEIDKHCEAIHKELLESCFVPDIILGHFVNPSLMIVNTMKDYYPQAQTVVSMHGQGLGMGYRLEYDRLFAKLDFIGYRSHSIRKAYESMYGKRPYLMCPSGVPEEYIVEKPKQFDGGLRNFIYVGSFMDRKHPTTIVEALAKAMGDKDYCLTFVGDGDGKANIYETAKRFGNVGKLRFTGRIPRNEVTKELDKADVFIMVSENETFGLVYLEAMSRGCITIASRNEGMDGYIRDGENGFLCKSGDAEELSEIIKRICNMHSRRLVSLSEESLATARSMTDKKVANDYIKVFENDNKRV